MKFIRTMKPHIPGTWMLSIIVASSFGLPAAAALKKNCVSDYLNCADLQCETREQRNETRRALSDMLVLKPSDLLKKRYCDYQMHKGQWTAIEVLQRYFLPADRIFIDRQCFASSVRLASAQKAITRMLKHIEATDAARSDRSSLPVRQVNK